MTRGFFPFLRKELVESLRTFRFVILAAVTAAFGILSPLMVKYLPAMMDALLTEEMMGGINLTDMMPPPSALAGWAEFISSVAQTGVIALVVVFAGGISGEIGKNTLIPLLSRGLSRQSVVCAKAISNAVNWTLSYAVSAGLTWCAIVLLFPGEETVNVFVSLICLWLYGLLMSAVALFASALCKNIIGALLVSAGAWAITMFISLFPIFERWNPLTLATCGITMLAGLETLAHYTPALILTVACTFGFVIAAMLVFRRKKV